MHWVKKDTSWYIYIYNYIYIVAIWWLLIYIYIYPLYTHYIYIYTHYIWLYNLIQDPLYIYITYVVGIWWLHNGCFSWWPFLGQEPFRMGLFGEKLPKIPAFMVSGKESRKRQLKFYHPSTWMIWMWDIQARMYVFWTQELRFFTNYDRGIIYGYLGV